MPQISYKLFFCILCALVFSVNSMYNFVLVIIKPLPIRRGFALARVLSFQYSKVAKFILVSNGVISRV